MDKEKAMFPGIANREYQDLVRVVEKRLSTTPSQENRLQNLRGLVAGVTVMDLMVSAITVKGFVEGDLAEKAMFLALQGSFVFCNVGALAICRKAESLANQHPDEIEEVRKLYESRLPMPTEAE